MDEESGARGDFLKNQGYVRTDMYCHECSKNFVATLNYSLDGNHEVKCPVCGHLHYRVIKNGKVTGDRYSSDSSGRVHKPQRVWMSKAQPIVTSSASHFIRERWLNRSDG